LPDLGKAPSLIRNLKHAMFETKIYPQALLELIATLRRLPGIGNRTAERLALAILDWPAERLEMFGKQLTTLKERIHPCRICGNLADADECRICSDPRRDRGLICVVEQATQIQAIEGSGSFTGVYHVLGGRIVPLDGKGPDDLRLQELLDRAASEEVRELILATSPDVEGEATAAYIARELTGKNLKITRIAAGVPVGADLSFADAATMAMAMNARHPMD
jgi:recombination protein RecR